MQKGSNKKILYVEDEPLTRELTVKLLRRFFPNIYAAADGVAAVDIFKKENIDILITDLSLPNMSGFELIEEIRSLNPDFPIIITTAYREQAENLENVKVVYKPVSLDELYQTLLEISAQF